LAGNEAKIQVTADIKQAESQINKLTKALQNLKSDAWIDIGKKAAQGGLNIAERNLKAYGKTLSAIDRQLGGFGKRLGDVAKAFDFGGKTVVGVAGINALAAAAAQLPRIFGSGGAAQALRTFGSSLEGLTSPINAITSAIQAMGPGGLAAAGGIAAATAAFMAFGPAAKRAVTGLDNLVLGGKIQSAFEGAGKSVKGLTNVFGSLNTEIKTTVQAMNALAEGMSMSQLRKQVSGLTKEMESFHSSTYEAWTAAQGLVAAKKAEVAEQRALNELVRKAQGLQPQDVRDAESARRKAYLTSGRNAQKRDAEAAANAQTELAALRAKEAAESAAARERLKGAAAARTLVELAKQEAELAKQNLEVRYNWLKVLREGQAATAARQSRLQGANYGLGQVPAGGQLFPGGNTRTAQEGYRQMLNAQALTKQAAADALQKTQARTVLEGKSVEVLRTRTKALSEQAAIDARSVEILRQQNAERIKAEQLDARALTVARRQVQLADLKNKKKKGEEMQKRVENTLVSGAFPLLFGAGPAATIGGFAGGAMGGTNPMIGVFTSAIGQIFDTIRQNLTDLGKSLREPTSALQAMETAGLRVGDQLRTTVTRLSEVGRSYEAQAAIFASIKQQLGSDGLQALFGLIQEQKRLEENWSKLTSVITSDLLPALVGATSLFADLTGGLASLASIQLPDWLKGLLKRGEAAVNPFAQLNLGLSDYGQGATKSAKAPGLTPEVLQKDADARLSAAERAEALRRQGIQLERQQQDFALSIADQVYGFRRRAADLERASIDLRRSVEDEIFRKRQEIARQEIENERQKKQLAIERTDLALAGGRVSGNQPGQDLANGLLDALRQYVRGRAEAEADLQQKERSFQVEMVELRRASERFAFEVARKVADLQRQAADYNRDVEKAKLTAERAIYDLQIAAADYRVAKAKEAIALETQAAQQLQQTNALTGQISGAGGRVVAHLHGDPGRPGYDPAGHGGQANAHDHYRFDSAATARRVASELSKLGYTITELKGVTSVSRHSADGGHYDGTAFDVPWAQFGSGPIGQRDFNRSRQLQRDIATILGAPQSPANNIVPTAGAPRAVDTSGAMSALNGLRAPGAGGVSSLMSSLEQLDAKLIKTKELSLSLAREFAAMTDQQRAEAWGNTVQAAIDSLNKPLDDILQKQGDQAAYQREYAELISQGVLPDLAKQILEIRDQVQLQLQQLDTAISVLEASKLKLQAEGKWTEELQKQLDLLKAQKGIIEGKGQQAEGGAKQAQSPGQRLQDAYNNVKGQLNELLDPVNQITKGAEAIGSAFGTAFKDMASGAKTAQQALSDMFKSIADHFLDMAAQMIAKWIEMQIIGLAASLLGGAAGGGGGSSWGGSGGSAWGGFAGALQMPKLYAEGGFVTGPTNALIGEAGESEYVIPSSKMASAMSRYAAGARGSSVIPDEGGSGSGEAGGGSGHFTLETVVINNIEYATVDQVRAMSAQAAKQGAAQGHTRSMRTLQNSRSQRSKLGMR
jgi:hypothetical protein